MSFWNKCHHLGTFDQCALFSGKMYQGNVPRKRTGETYESNLFWPPIEYTIQFMIGIFPTSSSMQQFCSFFPKYYAAQLSTMQLSMYYLLSRYAAMDIDWAYLSMPEHAWAYLGIPGHPPAPALGLIYINLTLVTWAPTVSSPGIHSVDFNLTPVTWAILPSAGHISPQL